MPRRNTLVLGVMAAVILRQVAAAADLTGTYEGKFSCSGVDGGGNKIKIDSQVELGGAPSMLEVSHTGDDLNVRMDGALFNGRVINDPKNGMKASIALAQCSASSDLDSVTNVSRFDAKVNRDKGKGTIKNLGGVFVTADSLSQCRGSWKMVDTANPGVGGCPAPVLVECENHPLRQDFANGMFGCPVQVIYRDREKVCPVGMHVCSAEEWNANNGGTAPSYHYWTNDNLRYAGDDGACTVSRTSGSLCYSMDPVLGYVQSPMRVCADGSGADGVGNECNWHSCGLDAVVDENFGGCEDNLTSGVLCCTD